MAERSSSLGDSPASVLVIELYDGSYGPTLRIDTQEGSALERLRSVFLMLARQKGAETILESSPDFQFSGLHRIRLRVKDQRRGRHKALERVEASGRVEFIWTLDAEGWETKAEMVESLLGSGRAGHQYLTTEGEDDALIELAFREGPRAT